MKIEFFQFWARVQHCAAIDFSMFSGVGFQKFFYGKIWDYLDKLKIVR